jgi:hypothetical protein
MEIALLPYGIFVIHAIEMLESHTNEVSLQISELLPRIKTYGQQ